MKRPRQNGCDDCRLISAANAVSNASGAVPPPEPRSALAGLVAVVTSDGVEVTQAIQNMSHSVPLVAGKRTVARVYLSATSPTPIIVHGLLKVRRVAPTGPWQSLRSLGPAHVDPAENGQLRVKRENESKSLNFLIPDALCTAGQLEVKLVLVWQTPPTTFLVPPIGARRTVTFVTSPPLRVRVLGVRYRTGASPATFEPSALDYTLIQSWLGRAYPVPRVAWSQAVVSAPSHWPFGASTINAFVRGIRMSDIAGGADKRTHYYGLVDDAGGANFMRGLASGIPGTADPSTVASGPTGSATWGWDLDGSYGDWYTGHELGHTFGRFHAEFCGAGGGAPYPFTNGQLSNADGAFTGFDVGDPAHGLPMRALPGTTWHDVMTYCASQWLSSFSYNGIRDRLVLEDALPAGPTPFSASRGRARGRMRSGSGAVHVVGTLNLTYARGTISHVTPYASTPVGEALLAPARAGRARGRGSAPTSGSRTPHVSLRLYGRANRAPQEFDATYIPDACTDPGADVTGMIDALIPASADATRLELVLNGVVVDTFEPGTPPRAVRNIRSGRGAAARRRVAGAAPAADDGEATLTWQEPGRPAAGARGRGAAPADTGRRYNVQVSIDGGQTWQTVGFDLRDPSTSIDRNLFGDAESVRVRVVSSNGFRSVASEATVRVADL